MIRKLTSAAALCLLAAVTIGFVTKPAAPQQGGTWSVDFDDPNKSGDATVKVDVSYTDNLGKKQAKTISTTVRITPDLGATQKKARIQDALNQEANKDANKVGGESLIQTSGGGDVMTITPAPDHPQGTFTGVKIEDVDAKEKGTNEKDSVHPPKPGLGLAEIQAHGDITGLTSTGEASTFGVHTSNKGLVSVTLAPGMRKIDLIFALRAELVAKGATTWVDLERMALFVLLENDGVGDIGVGTDDSGLESELSVMGPENPG